MNRLCSLLCWSLAFGLSINPPPAVLGDEAALPQESASAERTIRLPRPSHPHAHYHPQPHPTAVAADRFRTSRDSQVSLPLPKETEAFSFVVFGDRTGGPPEGIEILRQAVRDVNLLEPDLVMTVGDLIEGYNNTEAWLPQMREYRSAMGRLLCPWFPVAGNHDIYWRGDNRPERHHEANYERHFGPLWYAFRHKHCMFVALFSDEGDPDDDSKSFEDPAAQRMSPEQFTWLKKTLHDAADAQHVFLFLHHPRWLGGGYGDDWERVHQLLADAGNVRIVFAGHIHRMRYDGPRDGIEYVTLATVGGGQQGIAANAGFLHHYHVVTVRPQQIALACLPVGEVIDVRQVTGHISDEVARLARYAPSFQSRPTIQGDRPSEEPLVVELFNPTDRPVEYEVMVDTLNRQWRSQPDHLHATVYPGQRFTAPIRLQRTEAEITAAYQPPELVLRTDYLEETARIGLAERRLAVPVRVELPSLPAADPDLAVSVDAANYFRVDDAALSLPDGPFTLECWCKARSFGERVGLVAKTERSEFGLFVGSGEPHFSVFLGDRYVEAAAQEPQLQVGRWHHVAGVFDNQEVRLYVDGRCVAARPGSGSRRTNHLPLIIGGDVDGTGRSTSGFDGWIDSVRLSTVARYGGEPFTPARRWSEDDQTILLLPFDGLVGPFTPDRSSRQCHAMRVGNPQLVRVEGASRAALQ